ncbi:proteasome maturation factor UMP1 [Mycena floridula]|nr:proteasome maturation factor UMP1 [Mycena floridula]
MEPSLRIVPAVAPKVASVADTANSFGLHNTLEHGPRTIAAEIKTSSGLKARLENWDETQDNLRLTMQRNIYGMHAPMRLLMERKLVSHNPTMPGLPQSNVHLDILMGRDETIDLSDVMPGTESGAVFDIHAQMEKKLRI